MARAMSRFGLVGFSAAGLSKMSIWVAAVLAAGRGCCCSPSLTERHGCSVRPSGSVPHWNLISGTLSEDAAYDVCASVSGWAGLSEGTHVDACPAELDCPVTLSASGSEPHWN